MARDAEVVVGRYTGWLLPGASTPGAASATVEIATRGVVYSDYSQVDVISGQAALRHIMDRVHRHRENGGQDEHFHEDFMVGVLTTGGFEWHRFFMGRPWGVQLWHQRVTSLHLVWRGAPALMVTTAVNPAPRFVTWHGSAATLCGGDD